MAPMEDMSRNHHNGSTLLLQGGGIYIAIIGVTVTIQDTNFYFNSAGAVSACFLKPSCNVLPWRTWMIAIMIAETVVC